MVKRNSSSKRAAPENAASSAEPISDPLDSMMPLDFMLSIMRNADADLADRKWAASQAAPYCHARLSTERGQDANPSHEDFLDLLL